MHDTRSQTAGHARIVLGAICILTLFAPFRVPVNSHAHMEATAQEAVLVCLQLHSPAFVLPPSVKHFSIVQQSVPEILANFSPRLEKTHRVDLQVPEVLLQTFLREEMTHGSTKLRVPETVLTTLFAEGEVQRLSRDQGRGVGLKPNLQGPR